MSVLFWIMLASLAGGALSVLAAAFICERLGAARLPLLVSYAIGALLGAAFLELLPHAFEESGDAQGIALTVLLGIIGFFILEKLVIWRHCHHKHCQAHDAVSPARDHGRSGLLILVGDTFHNFVDGILITAAFMQDTQIGIVTALAIIAHEIPQELGDYVVLRHSGYSRRRALIFNLISSLATLIGGLLAYVTLASLEASVPYVLAIAAASMMYIAIADLIPGLHERSELSATLEQAVMISLGIITIFIAQLLFDRDAHGHDQDHDGREHASYAIHPTVTRVMLS